MCDFLRFQNASWAYILPTYGGSDAVLKFRKYSLYYRYFLSLFRSADSQLFRMLPNSIFVAFLWFLYPCSDRLSFSQCFNELYLCFSFVSAPTLKPVPSKKTHFWELHCFPPFSHPKFWTFPTQNYFTHQSALIVTQSSSAVVQIFDPQMQISPFRRLSGHFRPSSSTIEFSLNPIPD